MTPQEHAALIEARKEAGPQQTIGKTQTRDILIQRGYKAVTHLFPKLAARLEKALDNENDPLHERAVDILSKRGLPIAFFESLAKSEFKTEEEGGAKPRIVINISTGGLPTQPAVVVTQDAEDVEFKELP